MRRFIEYIAADYGMTVPEMGRMALAALAVAAALHALLTMAWEVLA